MRKTAPLGSVTEVPSDPGQTVPEPLAVVLDDGKAAVAVLEEGEFAALPIIDVATETRACDVKPPLEAAALVST